TRSGPDWMFDLDFLTNTINYIPVSVENQVNVDAEDVIQAAQEKPFENATKDKDVQGSEDVAEKEEQHKLTEVEQALKDNLERMVAQEMAAKAMDDATRQAFEEEKRKIASQKRVAQTTNINNLNIGRTFVSASNSPLVSTANTPYASAAGTPTEDDSDVFPNDGIFSGAYDDEDMDVEADFNNMDNTIDISPIPTLIVYKDHPKGQILGDPKSAVQTRGKIQKASSVQQALVFKNKKDERSIVVKNKARLVAQGFRQEEGIDYDEVFSLIAKIEAIRLFLAFASFMGFLVYQMGVKSEFIYDTTREEVYVHQPPGFVDPAHPNKVYKSMCTKFKDCMHKRFQMSSMGKLTFFLGLQVKQQPDGIFISQDKYVADILNKFDFCSIKTATTPIESNKPLVKNEDGIDVDVHVNRSMIGFLMYLTASRPDIMFTVCVCARFQVTLKASHLNAVKRIFRRSLDKKSTTGGCQFLGRRLISWQCKKQTIVANSIIEAEYVAAANCCGQVLWIQNQMMNYGFNFMNTKIHIDNESTICIVKNPVYHSRTKHIEIRHHFIMDCYEKRLVDVIKIHIDANVADLLTKGFDVTRFKFLVLELILIRTSMNLRIDRSCAGRFSHIWSMANLRYSDKHNMVAFLKKPTESVGFTKIVDFLKGTSLRGYVGEHVPLLPAMLAGVAKDQDEATTTSVRVETEGASTTTSGLDAGMDNGNIHESPLRSHEVPLPKGNTSGSAEDSLQLKELMAIVPKMVTKINSLDKELKETKQTLGHAVLTLVKKVKSLKVAWKRMSKRVILSDSEDEETENQGRKIQDIDDDPLVYLVRNSMEEKKAYFVTPKKLSASWEAQEEDISPIILEAAQILSQVVSLSVSTYKRKTRSANKSKDIGIGMDFFSVAKERLNFAKVEVNTEVNPGSAGVNTATQKKKEHIRREEVGLAETMRLQALQDEEDERQVHLDALLAKRIQEEQ
ncbi:putative ribonuclease H-like domain-containing protein, partial [Tanacetum coccineum]